MDCFAAARRWSLGIRTISGSLVHHVVLEVVARLDAQEGQVEPAAGERFGEVRRIVAGDRDLDVLQFVAQHMHGPRQPVHLVPGLEADGERLSCRLRGPARRFDRGIDLHQRQPGMVEKGLARGGQFDAVHAAAQQLDADLVFEIADLPAERRLRRVQPFLGRERQAAFLGDGDEIAKVPQLHSAFHACEACRPAYKVFFAGARGAYMRLNGSTWRQPRPLAAARRRCPCSAGRAANREERNMSNPVVLITGALTGIGRAAAVAFAKKGAKVVVAGRRDEAGKALVKELRSFGSEAEFINADVRKEDDVRALVDKTVARFGRLDVAVNNAGTEGQVGPITDQTAESYAATFDTNVLGVILSMKHEVRVMQAQGSGSIINISSTYGHEGAAGASVYVGSKHAVEGITKSVALEIAKSGIRVNAVAPGPTDTGMLTRFTGTPENKAALVTTVPMGRLGLSEELANAIVFIASDEASFITGHVLNVDGGHTAN